MTEFSDTLLLKRLQNAAVLNPALAVGLQGPQGAQGPQGVHG